jgi:glucose/arabinose dehydrogenase
MKHLVTTCILAALLPVSISTAAEVGIESAFPTLPLFESPTNIQDPMDGTDRLFVSEQTGRVWVFENDPSVTSRTLFLDLSPVTHMEWEAGFLGLAFDPNYENNGTFYVYYNTDTDTLVSRLSRFHVSGDPDLADLGSEQILFEIPQSDMWVCHKGGCLAFGPDGYLYIATGDNCDGWPSQSLDVLAGKLLRIDVHVPSPGTYVIPPDNPFADNTNGWREEIYAYGFRNPWRFSFDAQTEELWLGDVGEGAWEEVDIIKKGRNYGWMKMEGLVCYPNASVCDTAGTNNVLPIWTFPHLHENGNSIIGGYVYRGPTLPSLWGKYVYTDYPSGVIYALSYDGFTATNDTIFNETQPNQLITTFGVDKDNELYFIGLWGIIYRLVDLTTGVADRAPVPATLRADPNPFHGSTTIHFAGSPARGARVEVFDVRGHLVRSLGFSGGDESGSVAWNGTDDRGREVASGVYFARLVVNGRALAHQRIVRVR